MIAGRKAGLFRAFAGRFAAKLACGGERARVAADVGREAGCDMWR